MLVLYRASTMCTTVVVISLIILTELTICGSATGLTTTTVTVNNTGLNLTTTPPPPTCPPDYTNCRCVFTKEPGKYYYDTGALPHQRSIWREIIAALYGFPFGVALSILTFFLYHYCCKSKESIYRKPTDKKDWRSNIKGRISPFLLPGQKLKSK